MISFNYDAFERQNLKEMDEIKQNRFKSRRGIIYKCLFSKRKKAFNKLNGRREKIHFLLDWRLSRTIISFRYFDGPSSNFPRFDSPFFLFYIDYSSSRHFLMFIFHYLSAMFICDSVNINHVFSFIFILFYFVSFLLNNTFLLYDCSRI